MAEVGVMVHRLAAGQGDSGYQLFLDAIQGSHDRAKIHFGEVHATALASPFSVTDIMRDRNRCAADGPRCYWTATQQRLRQRGREKRQRKAGILRRRHLREEWQLAHRDAAPEFLFGQTGGV